jgi:hypothetical protein
MCWLVEFSLNNDFQIEAVSFSEKPLSVCIIVPMVVPNKYTIYEAETQTPDFRLSKRWHRFET